MFERWLLLLMLTGLAATCGQKGPLDPPPRFGEGRAEGSERAPLSVARNLP